MTNDQIRDIASDIQSWLQDAVGDMAEGQTMLGKEIAADDAYENEDILSDLSGDRIFDSCKMNYVDMIAVATEIRDSRYSHQPLKNVMDRFIVRWEESLRKAAERDAKRAQREAEVKFRKTLEEEYGTVYNTTELQEAFEVSAFAAPYVVVVDKKSQKKGSLQFTHRPRFYFRFVAD